MMKKQETPATQQLDPKVASQMLSNILDVCDHEANTVPLVVLEESPNYHKEQNFIQRALSGLMLLVLLLLPLLFITPEITLEQTEAAPGAPLIQVRYEGFMPIHRISAMIDNYRVMVQETEDGQFQIRPNRNGHLLVEVTLANRQSATKDFQISGVDFNPPRLLGSERMEGELVIYFEDDSGTLDFGAAYAMNSQGECIYPLSYDAEQMSITFAYPNEPLNIFVRDMSGNDLQMVLTVR